MADVFGLRRCTELQYVVASTKEEADYWVKILKDHVKEYGYAKVAYLYELAGIKTLPNDFEYGWTKEEDISYVKNADGYLFNLPRPVKLTTLGTTKKETTTTVKIYLVLEKEVHDLIPSLHDVYPTFDEALGSAYTKASVVHGTCQQHEGHYPLLIRYSDKGFRVIDEKEGTCHTCYVEEREVEVC